MTKIRAVRIVIKDMLVFFMIIAVMAVIVTTACVVSVKNAPIKKAKAYSFETIEEFAARNAKKQKIKEKEKEENKKIVVEKIPPYHSTMCRMYQGKESTKGDYVVALENKEARRIKRIRERKRREKEKREKEKREREKYFSESNLELMAHLIYGEAGDQCDECQQAVGMVIINRINDKDFKCTTIREAIFAPSQYACTTDGNFYRTPSKQAYRNAKAVLTGNTIYVPKNVVYQSQFRQGSGVWRKIGTETICFK